MQEPDIVNYINQIGDAAPIHETFNPVFWLFMLFNLVAIALVRTLNPSYLRVLLDTALRNRQLVNNLREDLDLTRFSSILLNFTFFSSVGVIIWMATLSDNNSDVLFITLALLLISIGKLIIIALTSLLTNTKLGIQEHLLNHFIFYQIGGVILTPILIFTHYVPESYKPHLMITLFSFIGLFIVVREFQSLVRALQYKISIFYIILYLCTLELLPLMVGIRVFILNSEVLN